MQPMATSVAAVPTSVSAAIMKLLADADMVIDADRPAAKSCIAEAAALLQAERTRHRPATGVRRGGLAPWQMIKVKAYVEANLGTPIRVAALAGCCRLSDSYFSVAFKRSLGITVPAYLAHRRVRRAQELILTTDEPLSRIALDCGFCDQAHLSRMFRRIIGVAPTGWRRQRTAQSP